MVSQVLWGAAQKPAAKNAPPAPYVEKKDLYDVPKVTVVANKKFYLNNEVTLQSTFLATDPYNKYLGLGGSYTHAFDNYWGWEMLNGAYAFAFQSGLANNLVSDGVNPALIDSLMFYGTTNITLSPLYMKNLVFNSATVYSEFAIVAGGGISDFTYGGIQPIIDAGIIMRYFLGPSSSLKFDIRDYIFPNGYTNNNIAISVGYAFDLDSAKSKGR